MSDLAPLAYWVLLLVCLGVLDTCDDDPPGVRALLCISFGLFIVAFLYTLTQ